MTKGELEDIQEFLQALELEDSGDHYLDDIGVFEGILRWLRIKYREQAPKKLGNAFNRDL